MFYLNVPYAEKDAARQLGARWDAESKKWYVPKGVLATPFAKWMPASEAAEKLLELSAGRQLARPARKLSMTESTIRSREKKAAERGPSGPPRRADEIAGKVTIGELYKPAGDVGGPPWAI